MDKEQQMWQEESSKIRVEPSENVSHRIKNFSRPRITPTVWISGVAASLLVVFIALGMLYSKYGIYGQPRDVETLTMEEGKVDREFRLNAHLMKSYYGRYRQNLN